MIPFEAIIFFFYFTSSVFFSALDLKVNFFFNADFKDFKGLYFSVEGSYFDTSSSLE